MTKLETNDLPFSIERVNVSSEGKRKLIGEWKIELPEELKDTPTKEFAMTETQLKKLAELERIEILKRVQELEELEKTKTPAEKAYKLVYGGFPITDGTENEYDELAWNAFYHGYCAGKGND